MSKKNRGFDVVIVGAGPAGVGCAYAFTHAGVENVVILERHEVGSTFDRWPTNLRALERIAANWQEPFGDRRQELVFIGIGLDEPQVRRDLDACLLTDAEMSSGETAWATLPDPFTTWDAA